MAPHYMCKYGIAETGENQVEEKTAAARNIYGFYRRDRRERVGVGFKPAPTLRPRRPLR